MLHQQIKSQIGETMKARDAVRLSVLRGMLAAFTNELVAIRRTPREELPEAEALAVVARLAKQRRESIEQFSRGGRDDLVAKEQAELAILETYLPEQLTDDAVWDAAKKKRAELGIVDKGGAGKLMAALMADLKGRADGKRVKEIVETVLAV